MPKGFISKDYQPIVVLACVVAVLLLGVAFFSQAADWLGWLQALGLIVGLVVAIAVPAIQRKREFLHQLEQLREREVGHARRLHYFMSELLELLAGVGGSLVHLRAADRHRCQRSIEDWLHRLFESLKDDLSDERIVIAYELRRVANDLRDELESGRSDRGVMMELEKRLQKLGQRIQLNIAMAERSRGA